MGSSSGQLAGANEGLAGGGQGVLAGKSPAPTVIGMLESV